VCARRRVTQSCNPRTTTITVDATLCFKHSLASYKQISRSRSTRPVTQLLRHNPCRLTLNKIYVTHFAIREQLISDANQKSSTHRHTRAVEKVRLSQWRYSVCGSGYALVSCEPKRKSLKQLPTTG
jgi:hypothetical protein